MNINPGASDFSEAEIHRLNKLIPEANTAFVKLADWMRKDGLFLYVGSCYRNPAEQLALFKAGKSANQLSWHNLGRALDVYPRLPDGKPDLTGKNLKAIRQMHAMAPRFGLTGLAFNADGTKRFIQTKKHGKLVKVWDSGHLECRAPYVSLNDAIKAELSLFA